MFIRSRRLLSFDCCDITSEAKFSRLTKPIDTRSAAPLEKNGFMAARMVRCLFGSVTESSKAAPPLLCQNTPHFKKSELRVKILSTSLSMESSSGRWCLMVGIKHTHGIHLGH